MRFTKYLFAGLAAWLVMSATAVATYAADEGLITKPSWPRSLSPKIFETCRPDCSAFFSAVHQSRLHLFRGLDETLHHNP
jgi:hypothetical protein